MAQMDCIQQNFSRFGLIRIYDSLMPVPYAGHVLAMGQNMSKLYGHGHLNNRFSGIFNQFLSEKWNYMG
jgi:hypothetical protein